MKVTFNRDLLARGLLAGEPLDNLLGRRTGRTTAIALRCLAEAISHPGRTTRLVDHHDSMPAHNHLLAVTRAAAAALGLTGLTFRADHTVCSNFAETADVQ